VEAVALVVPPKSALEEKVDHQSKFRSEVRTPLPQENTMLVVVKELEVLSLLQP
tara:strand:- start:165 stop:326 length:162 start_codon:yes stop_codon:yes gene_type:complete